MRFGGIDAFGLVPVGVHDFSGGARGFHGGTASVNLVETVFINYLWNDFISRFQLFQLRGAFFSEQFLPGGFDGVEQIGGLEQARGADVTRPGFVKRLRHVRKQFGMNDDLSGRVQFANLSQNFQIVRAPEHGVGQGADDDLGFAQTGMQQNVALRDVTVNRRGRHTGADGHRRERIEIHDDDFRQERGLFALDFLDQ